MRRFLLASLFVLLLSILAIAVHFRYGPRDMLALFLGFDPCGTIYARGFSESGFAHVRVGMREADVVHLLGQPLYRLPAAPTEPRLWQYTWQRTAPSNFHHRAVSFDRAGRVDYIVREYWID